MSNNYYEKPNYTPSNENGGEKPFYDNAPATVAQTPSYIPPPQNYYYNNPQYNAQNYPVQAFPVSQNYYPPQYQNAYYEPYVKVNDNPIISSPIIGAESPDPQNSVAIVILNFVLIGISIIDIILQVIFQPNTLNQVADIINIIFSVLIIILYFFKVNLKHPCVIFLLILLLIIFVNMGGLGLTLGLTESDPHDNAAAFFVSLFTGVFFLVGRIGIIFCLIPLSCDCKKFKNNLNLKIK